MLPQHGRLEAVAAVDELVAELAHVAELPGVDRRFPVADGADDAPAAVDLEVHLAADGAVRARGLDRRDGLVPLVIALHEGADGAHVDAGAAELAARLEQRYPLRRADEHGTGPLDHRDGVVAAHLLADADAARADDAEVVVAVVEGVARLNLQVAVVVGQRRFHVDVDITNGVLELAPLVLGADHAPVHDAHVAQADVLRPAQLDAVARQAAVGVLREEQLQHALSEASDLRAQGVHDHAVRDGQRARGGRSPAALDLDAAHAARAVGLHARPVAQVRDVHVVVEGRLQHRLPRLSLDLNAVYCQLDGLRHRATPLSSLNCPLPL